MIHYTNLGKFGTGLKKYADLGGFVPEAGDSLGDFEYPNGWFEEGDLEEWEMFVAEAVQVTEQAEESLCQWLQE